MPRRRRASTSTTNGVVRNVRQRQAGQRVSSSDASRHPRLVSPVEHDGIDSSDMESESEEPPVILAPPQAATPVYSQVDRDADEDDLFYQCPLTLGFAVEDPVIFQEHIFERASLQFYFDFKQGSSNLFIPHPKHRAAVECTEFLDTLASPVSAQLQRAARSAERSYESRTERRHLFREHASRRQQEQQEAAHNAARDAALLQNRDQGPENELLPDYWERMEVLRSNSDYFSDQAINPLSYEWVLRRPRTPERAQHEDRPGTPVHLQRYVGEAPPNHFDSIPAPQNNHDDLPVELNDPAVDPHAPQEVVERGAVLSNGVWRTGLALTNFFEQAPEALETILLWARGYEGGWDSALPTRHRLPFFQAIYPRLWTFNELDAGLLSA